MKKLLSAILCISLICIGCAACSDKKKDDEATGDMGKTVMVEMEIKDFCTVKLELYPDIAPITVANFVKLAGEGFYDGLTFHRIYPGFMIQGGGHTADMQEKANSRKPVVNEAGNGLKNDAYTIAMARTNDPDSATAQFFINVANNDFLNHKNETPSGYGYAVFGKVIQGQDVVDRIKSVSTGSYGPYQDVPKTPVIIKSNVPVQ